MASSGNVPAANNLLSPNAAFEQVAGAKSQHQQQQQQRRKSTLSANGFFIDYSCTRRRSSAAREQRDFANRNQFVSSYVSPVRCQAVGGGDSSSSSQQQSYNSPSRLLPTNGARSSRASYSAGTSSSSPMAHRASFLVPGLYAPSALAGSRKTSIFDPAGHSMMAPHLIARRKSTMVTAGGLLGSAVAAAAEPAKAASSTMISVARKAAKGGRRSLKGELAQHVPVIGCSPTSIQASLAALEETKRYERLLRRLKNHKERKEKRRNARLKAQQQGQFVDDQLAQAGRLEFDKINSIQSKPAGDLRRRSLKMIRDAASLLNKAGQTRSARLGSDFIEDTMDDLSISSISQFSRSSSRTSLVSLDRCEINNDELFVDENTLMNFNDLAGGSSSGESNRKSSCQITEEKPSRRRKSLNSSSKRSFVRVAMKKLLATIATPSGKQHQPLEPNSNRPAAIVAASQQQQPPRGSFARSMSVVGLNYRYYYYYLRQNSLDAIDDLPITHSSGSFVSDHERRAQLHINYSLARIEILNSEAAANGNLQSGKTSEDGLARDLSLKNLSDFSQSTDFLLSMSTTSSSSLASASLDSVRAAPDRKLAELQGDTLEGLDSSNSTTISGVSSVSGAGISGGQRISASNRSSLDRRQSRRASDTAADDECTSVDMEPCRMSVSVSPPVNHRQVPPRGARSSRKTASLRPLSATAKRKSTSGEMMGAWRDTERRHSSRDNRGSILRANPSSRYSHNNLAVEQRLESTSMASDRRSASFANTSSNCLRKNNDTDDSDKELDDFERFNRSHRGYKPPQTIVNLGAKSTEMRLRPTKSLRCRNSAGSSSFKLAKRVGSFIISRIGPGDGGSEPASKLSLQERRNFSQSSSPLTVNARTTCNEEVAPGGAGDNDQERTKSGARRAGVLQRASGRCKTEASPGSLRLSGSNRHNHHAQRHRQPARPEQQQGGFGATSAESSSASNNNNNNNDNDNHGTADQSNSRADLVCAQRDADCHQRYCNFHSRAVQPASRGAGAGADLMVAPAPPSSCDCLASRRLQQTAGYDYGGAPVQHQRALDCGQAGLAAIRAKSQSSLINLGCFANDTPRPARPIESAGTSSMLRLPVCEFRQQAAREEQVVGGRSRRCLSAAMAQPEQPDGGGAAAAWQVWGSCNDIIIIGAAEEGGRSIGACSGCKPPGGSCNHHQSSVCQECANLELALNDRRADQMRRTQRAGKFSCCLILRLSQ